MAFGFKDVTPRQPCPLCGRKKWCAWMPSDYGRLLMCQSHSEDQSFLGNDGLVYVHAGTTRSGVGMYEEESQYMRRTADYKASGKSGKPGVPQQAQPKRLTVVDEVKPLSNDVLNRIYRSMLSKLVLEDRHRVYLHNEGWTDDLIEKNHIVSMPVDDFRRYNSKSFYESKNPWRKVVCRELADEFSSLRGVPGFYRKDGVWKMKCRSGIIFPLYDVNHNVYRLRIRMDFEDLIDDFKDGKYINCRDNCFVQPLKGPYVLNESGAAEFDDHGGKYRSMSSYKEDEDAYEKGFIENIYSDGCRAENSLGVYCNTSVDDFYCVYITEGEKKGIIGNHILKAPFLTIPGVNSFSLVLNEKVLNWFISRGTKIFIIAFDADKVVNKAVMDYETKAINALREKKLFVGLAEWDANIGKGIDDILVKGYRPGFSVPN